MKKTLFVLSILSLVTLASCGNITPENPTPDNLGENNNNNNDDNSNNNPEPEEKTVPVYQGMEVKDSASSSDKKSARKFNSDIEVGTDQIDYYAPANSDFYLHIHIYNPEQFEILSFTLNDYKYQSYQFEEGSTGSLLILKLKTPLEAGYHEYFLSNIKYVDGTEIKDVDMSEANKSVKIGVQYMDYPTFEMSDEQIGYEKYSATFSVEDYQNVYLQYGATISVSKDDKVVFEKDYTDEIIYLQLDNLETNSEYLVEIHSKFETFKGNGVEDVLLYSDSFTTENGVQVVTSANKRDASFEINSYLDNFSILKADLFKDGTLVTSAEDLNNIKFENLYSDSDYELVLSYEYGQNYYHGEEKVSFTTKEVTTPNAETEIISTSKNSAEFKTNTTDSDNTIKEITYELYDGSKLVDSSKDGTTVFDGLLSNHSYSLKTIVTYDLYNGEGNKTLELTNIFTTLENNLPTVTIGTISPSYESVDFDFKIDDSDKVVTDVKVILADYDGTVKTGDENTRSFDSILSGHYYELNVEVTYDLKDGNGEQTIFGSEYFYTETYEAPQVSLSNYVTDNGSIEFDMNITDVDNLIKDITINLYDNGEIVATGDENTRSFDSLLTDHHYDIEVVTTFDMKDGEGDRKIYFNDSLYTKAYITPEVKLSNVVANYESVDFDLEVVDDSDVITDVKYNVLDNGEIVATGDENTTNLDSLLSNHEYQLQAIVTYDMRDGNGEHSFELIKNFHTLKYDLPDIYFTDVVAENGSIEFKLNEDDEYNLVEFKSIDLYENDVLKETITDLSNLKFDNLSTGVKYNLAANYVYDNHDGSGKHLLTVCDNGYATIDGEWTPNARQLPENIQAIRVTEDRVYGVFFLGIPEEKRISFWEAQEMCETYGGHLITITSDEELQIAQDLLDEQNYEINNVAGSLVGGYYENESWHWVTGEEFVVNRDHFYYPSTIGPSEGDVLATWFESAKFWYQSPDTKNPAVLIELEGDKPTTGIYLK